MENPVVKMMRKVFEGDRFPRWVKSASDKSLIATMVMLEDAIATINRELGGRDGRYRN